MAYKNSPIVETLLDIQFNSLDNFEEIIESAIRLNDIIEEFTEIKYKVYFQGNISTQSNEARDVVGKPQRIAGLFTNKENTKQVMIREDGFSFHHLNYYEGWDSFFPQAMKFWSIYISKLLVGKEVDINRLAVRTINRIDLPLPFKDFDDYITIVPQIPDSLPQILSGLFSQVKVPVTEDNLYHAIINQTFENTRITNNILPYLLDIDILRLCPIPSKMGNDEIAAIFEKIHTVKNSVFESCITDNARDLFNK